MFYLNCFFGFTTNDPTFFGLTAWEAEINVFLVQSKVEANFPISAHRKVKKQNTYYFAILLEFVANNRAFVLTFNFLYTTLPLHYSFKSGRLVLFLYPGP